MTPFSPSAKLHHLTLMPLSSKNLYLLKLSKNSFKQLPNLEQLMPSQSNFTITTQPSKGNFAEFTRN